jgi:vacuolar-type H+-ATPase subunit I/STV1
MFRKDLIRERLLMKCVGFPVGVCAFAALLSPLHADPRYPDWPCAQPKVPELSAATMWDGPSIADVGNTWQDDLKVRDLVELIATRRTPLEAARKAITEFIVGTPAEKEQKAKQAFAGLFEALSEQRREVMDGLERVSRKEVDLAAKIKSDVTRLRELQDKPDADQTEIKNLASEIEWSTRIFEDRRKTIRYVCEVPTTIEQRIFALARTIQQTLN